MSQHPCPHCSLPIEWVDQLAVQEGNCPSCGQPLWIPKASAINTSRATWDGTVHKRRYRLSWLSISLIVIGTVVLLKFFQIAKKFHSHPNSPLGQMERFGQFNAPSPWTTHELFGLGGILMPHPPQVSRVTAPQAISNRIEGGMYDAAAAKSSSLHVSVVHIAYTQGNVPSLEEMREGSVSAISNVATLSHLEKTYGSMSLSGRPALWAELAYTLDGKNQAHHILYILDGNQSWQVAVIGKPDSVAFGWKLIRDNLSLVR